MKAVTVSCRSLGVDPHGIVRLEVTVRDLPPVMGLLETLARRHDGWGRLTLQTPWKPRTTGWKSQNHHLFGHAAQIGRHLGYDRREMVYLIAEMTDGWPMVEYKGRMVPCSESKISVEAAAAAIEVAHRIAAENGIALVEDGSENVD